MVASFMLILDTSQYLSCNRTVNYAICYSGNPIHQLMILCDHAFVAHRQSDFQWDGISKTGTGLANFIFCLLDHTDPVSL